MLNRALSALLLAVGLLAGLGFPLVADDAAKEAPPKQTSLIGEVVTSGEFVEAAQAIEAAAKEGWTELAEFYDLNALVEICFAGIKAKEDYYKQYKSNFAGPAGTKAFLGPLAETVKKGGKYELLRAHRDGPNCLAVFRLTVGLLPNYHILRLVKGVDGKVKVHDLYVLSAGEWMSTLLRRTILPVAASQNRTLLERLVGTESHFVTHAAEFGQLTKAGQTEDYAKFKAIYDELPKPMQEDKSILLLRRGAADKARQSDDVRAATSDLRRLYPGDAALDVLSLPGLLFEREFDDALACVDRIDKFVGGDPYLDTVRANIKSRKP